MICEFDVRRVLFEDRDVERYLGIQRPVNISRVRDLADYVNYRDATFPSAIIIAVDERCATYDPDANRLTLRNILDPEQPVQKRRIARVIDGQHRIAGLKLFRPSDEAAHFDCMVTVLIGMDIADQAHVFATVNLEQSKVNRSLAIDLYSLERTRSPYKTCHTVVVALDRDPSGPFYQRVKRLGVTTTGRTTETLAQATVVDGLMPYISNDPDGDRDLLLRGKKPARVDPRTEQKLLLRNWFLDDDDAAIALVYTNFFEAVRRKWPEAWDKPAAGQVLSRTTGYLALSRLFGDVYREIANIGESPPLDAFMAVIDRARLPSRDINAQNFLPGSSGQSLLYRTLRMEVLGR